MLLGKGAVVHQQDQLLCLTLLILALIQPIKYRIEI